MYAHVAFILAMSTFLLPFADCRIKGKSDHETLGVLLLDAITFPKVVPHPLHAVVVLVCNKGEIGQYATDSIRADYFSFAEKGNLQGSSDKVLFSQVIVNGAQNARLASRIGVPPNFKHPKMFLYLPNSTDNVPYPDSGAFNDLALTRFVSKHTDFFFGVPGTIENFDQLAEKFVAAHPADYDSIIAEAETLSPTVELKDKANTGHYIKAMQKIKESGLSYIPAEIKRLESILASDKISDKKKSDMQKRLNIMHQFDRKSDAPDL